MLAAGVQPPYPRPRAPRILPMFLPVPAMLALSLTSVLVSHLASHAVIDGDGPVSETRALLALSLSSATSGTRALGELRLDQGRFAEAEALLPSIAPHRRSDSDRRSLIQLALERDDCESAAAELTELEARVPLSLLELYRARCLLGDD
jgi:hypothetical protein